MNRNSWLSLFLVLVIHVACHGQALDCLQMVRGAYQAMNSLGGSNRIIHTQYTAKTLAKHEGRVITTTSKVEMISSLNRMHLVSDRAGDLSGWHYLDHRSTWAQIDLPQ